MPQLDQKARVPLLFEEGHQKSPRITMSFLDLPFKIRKDIYVHILRPDCSLYQSPCKKKHKHADTFLGCTNILMTSSHVWREAIELLHRHEAVFHLDEHYQYVLRGPREFGKQGFFGGAKWDRPFFDVYRLQFDELQLIRLRKVALIIEFPAEGQNYALRGRKDVPVRHQTRLTRARDKVKEIAAALGKSHTIETVRIVVDSEEHNPVRELLPVGRRGAHLAAVKRSLKPLIDAARRADFTLIFDQTYDEHDPADYPDPVLM